MEQCIRRSLVRTGKPQRHLHGSYGARMRLFTFVSSDLECGSCMCRALARAPCPCLIFLIVSRVRSFRCRLSLLYSMTVTMVECACVRCNCVEMLLQRTYSTKPHTDPPPHLGSRRRRAVGGGTARPNVGYISWRVLLSIGGLWVASETRVSRAHRGPRAATSAPPAPLALSCLRVAPPRPPLSPRARERASQSLSPHRSQVFIHVYSEYMYTLQLTNRPRTA